MRECPVCFGCYDDSVNQCPVDSRATFNSLAGDVALEGKYILERRLGEGGMGVVYKAQHKFLKTTRAIKIIRPDLVGNDPSFATRFHQEAMAAAAIGHPNIISVPDFGFIDEKIPFIVMEYVEGISLQDLMTTEGRFTPEKALEYMRVIASAIGAAHAHGIVHRDLKPLNVMINQTRSGSIREQIRILDFGLAKIKSADLFGSFVGAKTTGIIGSPYYMAPEQWSDEETDKRCDIYSMGIILHQMLTGDVPFKGSSIPAIMKKHLMTPPPPLALTGSGISSELEKVVHHALEKDPKLRTASTEDFVSELEQAVATSGAAKAKPKTRTRTRAKPATRAKLNEAKPDGAEPPDAEVYQAEAPGQLSGEDLKTIVKPALHESQGSSPPSQSGSRSNPTSGEADVLLRASEEARRRAEAKALREIEESSESPFIASNPSPRHSTPPSLPGRALVGQHSVVSGFFRRRFVLPITAAVVVLGAIALFSFVYFRPDTDQPVVIHDPAVSPPKLRDMALIQGGTFTMGSDVINDLQRGAHRVTVPSFYLDKYEVTNADYAEFIKATGHPAPTIDESDRNTKDTYWKPWNGTDPPPGRERWPVCNVSPKDAADFADWLSNRDGVKYRLPTEEEWEYAARNRSIGSHFPWGNSWVEGRANLNERSSPTNVGSFPEGATQDGVLDMIGNVWEWTSSKAKYYDGRHVTPQEVNAHVWRGGSFAEKINDGFHDATSRGWYPNENYKFPSIGFRLARDAQ